MRAQLRAIIELAKRSPLRVRIALILLGLYLACPIDLIPDFIPVLGQLDDILLIGLVGGYVVRQVPEFAQYLPSRRPK